MVINPIMGGGSSGGSMQRGTFRFTVAGSPLSIYSSSSVEPYPVPFIIGMTWREYVDLLNGGSFLDVSGDEVSYWEEGLPQYVYVIGVNPDDEIIDGHTYALSI